MGVPPGVMVLVVMVGAAAALSAAGRPHGCIGRAAPLATRALALWALVAVFGTIAWSRDGAIRWRWTRM